MNRYIKNDIRNWKIGIFSSNFSCVQKLKISFKNIVTKHEVSVKYMYMKYVKITFVLILEAFPFQHQVYQG